MIKSLTFFSIFSFYTLALHAQTSIIKGIIKDDADKTPIIGATVVIYLQRDSTQTEINSAVTNTSGAFLLSGISKDSFVLELSSVGYEKIQKRIVVTDSVLDIGLISFFKKSSELADVTIVAKTPPTVQKGDTTQFSASQYKVNPDATTEDLIKKMPGITVAKDGTVTAQGETIKKVTIDGRDFFGDDASAALKNLPSEVVDKIQVFDRLSDQAQLTGFDDGNSVKAINIVTKTGIKNGQFGRIYAGYGTDNRYAGGGNISFFKGNRRLSFVGNFNNINQQNFGSQDLLGIAGSNSGSGRGGRGAGGAGGGASDNFSVGQSAGISKTNAFGINYGDQWGKKVTITGSYFFNNSTNNNISEVNTQTFIVNTQTIKNRNNLFSLQNSNPLTDNYNHRINFRIEYKIDSSNSIFIIPSLNFQKNNSGSFSTLNQYFDIDDSVSTANSQSSTNRNGYNLRNNILFRHAFHKRGRSLSFGLNISYNKNDGESITNARYRFFDSTGTFISTDSLQNQYYNMPSSGHTIGGNIAYTEPIGKKGQLQINYSPSIQKNKADQQTFGYDGQKYSQFDTTLSNRFDNTITTHNAGLNYRLNSSKDEQLAIGANFQYSTLQSQRIFPKPAMVNQSFANILPNAMWRKKLSVSSNIRIMYRASTNFPSINQLQDVVNQSNPLSVSSGNPDLKQSYTHLLSGRYTYTNSKTSRSFFANIFLQTASDYISNATFIPEKDSVIQQNIVLKRGSQLTKPVNLDGYKSLRTFFTYSFPVKLIKTTVNLNAGFSYSKLPGLVNYVATTTNNYVYNGGVVFASNISQYVDFNLSYNASVNDAQTSYNNSSSKYINQSAGIQINLLSKSGWFVQNDVNNQNNSGLSSGFNQSYWLWNAAIGKKFLKKQSAELKLSVFDLLKQNQSITRTVTGSYIQDVQSQVLQQYFMLTFTYSLKNFGTAAKVINNGSQGRDRMTGQPGGGMMNPGF